MPSLSKYLLSVFCTLVLTACGAAHVRTEKQSTDLHEYKYVVIDEVDVYSKEDSAVTNAELQAKMREWEVFARKELENYVEKSHYQLKDAVGENPDETLVVDLDVDLVYGNRAARYFAGFGAGKGSVDSTLTVVDSQTSDVKFKAIAESDLSGGGFGGDMEKVLKTNIEKLVDQYPTYQK